MPPVLDTKIKSCELLYADGDKYAWSVVSENAISFPIDADLCADGCIWENNGVKKILVEGEWVQEDPRPISQNGIYDVADVKQVAVNVAGGSMIPTVILNESAGTYTCGLEFDDLISLIDESPYESAGIKISPCLVGYSDSTIMGFVTAHVDRKPAETVVRCDNTDLHADGTIGGGK